MYLLTNKYLEIFKKETLNIKENIKTFRENSKNIDFSFLIESSSVFSSNIEGNSLDLNSFQNAKMNKIKNKDVEEIDALIEAYNFAKENKLCENNFLKSHKLSSKTILISSKRGVYRNERVGVFGKSGLIYLAIEEENVGEEMKKLFRDIEFLLEKKLQVEEVFYYASLIHLVFVHIHPFSDGNGRTARLLEKWFLTSALGEDFWKLESEKFYKENRQKYYENINLGVNYYELNYDNCLNFLYMLPKSLIL